jgi:hypothetical protein
MKRSFLLFLLLFFASTSAGAADPLKIHDGGFGPSIDGLQLGQTMTWQDIIKNITANATGPFGHVYSIFIADRPESVRMDGGSVIFSGEYYVWINMNGNKGSINIAGNAMIAKLPQQGSLEEYFAVLYQNKMHYVYTHRIAIYNNRVTRYSLFASDLQAPAFEAKDFSEWLSEKYDLGPIEKKKENYEVSSPSEGWRVVVSEGRVEVSCMATP